MAGYEVLILDDESRFLQELAWALSRDGFQVTIASPDFPRQYPHPEIANFDLIAGRVVSPFDDLKNLFDEFKSLNPNGAVIVLSRDYDYAFPVEAFQLKIDDYILMPGSLYEVRRRIITCLNEIKMKYLSILSNRPVSEMNCRAFKLLTESAFKSYFLPEMRTPRTRGAASLRLC
ncbi:MAG: response regulator [Deltaproteobacteria bacterium]|nr:response regulator [Deltaproteobacteria bacterium]